MIPHEAASVARELAAEQQQLLRARDADQPRSSQVAPLSALKPRSMNGSQKHADSAAIVKSAASASWKPSPAAQPRTRRRPAAGSREQLDQPMRLERRAALEAAGARSRPAALDATQSAPEQKSRRCRRGRRRAARRRWRRSRAPRRCADRRDVERVLARGAIERDAQHAVALSIATPSASGSRHASAPRSRR
jgi:hypothetical protein